MTTKHKGIRFFDDEHSFVHLLDESPHTYMVFCDGLLIDAYTEYEIESKYEILPIKKGSISCPECISRLKYYKSVKL